MKRYIISSILTFVAGFCIAILPDMESLTLETLKAGAWVGIVFAGARAGLKAVMEVFVAWYAAKH